MPPRPDRLGNYEPLLDLASGGMGTVHIARQVGAAGFERLVVLKRVHRRFVKDEAFRDMFVDEARVASLIRHPNVVSVIDVVEDKGEIFLVMEYVESLSLGMLAAAARKAGEPLPVPVVARILSDVLAGLTAAHDATDMQGRTLDVVHRDVSPQNVVVGVDGQSRLIDFGIAKAARRLTHTTGGVLKGKLGYMAPEQLKQLPVDRRADVFATGVVLFEALTGQRPFPEDDEDALLALLLGDVPDPSSLSPDVPEKLDAVVQYALARERDDRFQTAAAFQQALETAVPPAPPREVARFVERWGGGALAHRRAELLRALGARDGSTEPGHVVAPGMEPTLAAVTSTHPDGGEGGSDESLLMRAGVRPRVPRVWVVAGVSTLVGVGVVALFASRRGPEAPSDAAPGLVSPAGTGAAATVAAEAPTPPHGTAATVASVAVTPAVTPAATHAPRATPPPQPTAQGNAGHPPAKPTGAPSAPKPPGELRENPYGTP
jgi:serine/threonine-protein kinase